jgi:hypothetical protein
MLVTHQLNIYSARICKRLRSSQEIDSARLHWMAVSIPGLYERLQILAQTFLLFQRFTHLSVERLWG